jgi:hypothetical protein
MPEHQFNISIPGLGMKKNSRKEAKSIKNGLLRFNGVANLKVGKQV